MIGDFSIAEMEGDYQDPEYDPRGSLRWMAPELFQYEQGQANTPKRDVWAFGMTIYVSLLLP